MSEKVLHVPAQILNLCIKAGIIILVCLTIGGMINFFSPLATLSMGPEERFWFWISLCLIGGIGIFICDLIFTALQIEGHAFPKNIIQSAAGTTAVLVPLYYYYDSEVLPKFGTTVSFVWIVMVLILMGVFVIGLRIKNPDTLAPQAEADVIEPPVDTAPALLKRLPVHLQNAALYAISAEDHYVRVHTSKGDTIILMRLSDAIHETAPVEGLQIHRSWWVAKAAVSHIKSMGRTAEVTLENNVKAPVSRSAVKTLKGNGWL